MSDSESSEFIDDTEDDESSSSSSSASDQAKKKKKKKKASTKKKTNKAKGRKRGKGRGVLQHQTKKWDLYSEHGVHLCKALIEGCDPNGFQDCLDSYEEPNEWIRLNYYTRPNLQRRYKDAGDKLQALFIDGEGFEDKEGFLKEINCENRRGCGVGLTGYHRENEERMPTNKKSSKKSKSKRVAGGDDGAAPPAPSNQPPPPPPPPPAAAPVPAAGGAAPMAPPGEGVDVQGLAEMLGMVGLDDLPMDETQPRLIMLLQCLRDPTMQHLRRVGTREALMIMLLLPPLMEWKDVNLKVDADDCESLLLSWAISTSARDPSNFIPKFIREAFPEYVEALKRLFQGQPKKRTRRISLPFRGETNFRRILDPPGDPNALPPAPQDDMWNRWFTKPLKTEGGNKVRAKVGLTVIFSSPNFTFDDVDAAGDKYKEYDMADEESDDEQYHSDPSPRASSRPKSNYRSPVKKNKKKSKKKSSQASSSSSRRRREEEKEFHRSGRSRTATSSAARPQAKLKKPPPPAPMVTETRVPGVGGPPPRPPPRHPNEHFRPAAFNFQSPFEHRPTQGTTQTANPGTTFPWSTTSSPAPPYQFGHQQGHQFQGQQGFQVGTQGGAPVAAPRPSTLRVLASVPAVVEAPTQPPVETVPQPPPPVPNTVPAPAPAPAPAPTPVAAPAPAPAPSTPKRKLRHRRNEHEPPHKVSSFEADEDDSYDGRRVVTVTSDIEGGDEGDDESSSSSSSDEEETVTTDDSSLESEVAM